MIPTIGNAQNMLSTYNAKDWVESGRIELNDRKSLKELNPNGPLKAQETFGEFLAKSLDHVNKLQNEANVAVEKLATGKSQALHETMLMVEEAEIAFKTMNQVRQKVLEAYKEIMKLQI